MKNRQQINSIHFQDYCLAQSSLEDAFLKLSETKDSNSGTSKGQIRKRQAKTTNKQVPGNNLSYDNNYCGVWEGRCCIIFAICSPPYPRPSISLRFSGEAKRNKSEEKRKAECARNRDAKSIQYLPSHTPQYTFQLMDECENLRKS